MKLVTIPTEKYEKYRLDVIFKGYKWDPQFKDNNTVAKHILVITKEEFAELERLTEKLSTETLNAEIAINNNLHLAQSLAIPKQIRRELKRMKNYSADQHVRLMRFDFHPTDNGYALSEVNSDVPGGFAEASILPELAAALFTGKKYWHKDFGEILANEIANKVVPNGKVAFVHCTSYSDDRQVMQFIGDKLENMGLRTIYAGADHLMFENNKALCTLDGNVGSVNFIFRFTPLEWLVGIKPKRWQGYFDTLTPSCNHPASFFTQSKKFPMAWNQLEQQGVDLSTWRALLPETLLEVRDVSGKDGFIYKPVYGRVGEGISIKEACTDEEYAKIMNKVKRNPKKYIAQKMFDSIPLTTEDEDKYHLCLGAYSVNGKAAGFYARISKTPRIDSNSADIPVLVEG